MRTSVFKKFGSDVENRVTSAEAIKAAGLDTTVELRDIFSYGQGNSISTCKFKKAVVRKEDDSILGIVGPGYHPIQNVECFDFVDQLVGEGRAKFHSSGQINDGSSIFITLDFGEFIANPKVNDVIERYITLMSSHDGSSSMKICHSAIRLVCLNGLTTHQSLGNVSIRHSKNYADKINAARNVLQLTENYYEWFENSVASLVATPFTKTAMEEFTHALIPDTLVDGEIKPSTRKENVRTEIMRLFSQGTGNHGATAWDAYNAVTEYTDHFRNYSSRTERSDIEAKYIGTLYGSGAKLKNDAFSLLAA